MIQQDYNHGFFVTTVKANSKPIHAFAQVLNNTIILYTTPPYMEFYLTSWRVGGYNGGAVSQVELVVWDNSPAYSYQLCYQMIATGRVIDSGELLLPTIKLTAGESIRTISPNASIYGKVIIHGFEITMSQ